MEEQMQQHEHRRSVDTATAVDINSRAVALLQRNEHTEALLVFDCALPRSPIQPIGAVVEQSGSGTAPSVADYQPPRQDQQPDQSQGVSDSDVGANMVSESLSFGSNLDADNDSKDDIEVDGDEEEEEDNEDASDFEDEVEYEVEEVDRGLHAYTIPLEDCPAFTPGTGSSPNNTYRFFNRALDIAMMRGCKRSCRSEVDAVLLYNIGLAYHRVGLLSLQNLYLVKAFQMYHFSLTIVAAVQSESPTDFDLIKLALCNNLGHLHAHFSKAVEAEHYLKCLHELLVKVMQKNLRMGVEADDVAVFTSSVVTGLGQLCPFATAA